MRGLKLIVLALALNFLIALAPGATWKRAPEIGSVASDLLLGTNHRSVSFSLLVVIGYSLLLTATLLAVTKGRTALLVPAVILCVTYGVLANHFDWPGGYYVRLLALGQIGAALGLVPRGTILNLSSRLELVMALYFAQILAMVLLPPSNELYIVHLLCTLAAMYCIARKCEPKAWLCRKLALLGSYSLLGYLFQIAFLQGLRHAYRFTNEGIIVAILATCVATLLCAELTQILRAHSKIVARIYTAILG